ncbi:MAG: hypothetical protein QM831_04930 [Kofleriaceae bacterium]
MFLTSPERPDRAEDAADHESVATDSPTRLVTTGGQLPPPSTTSGSARLTASEQAYGAPGELSVVKRAAQGAVGRVIADPHAAPTGVVATGGHALGVALGVIVTEALAAVPSWNTPVVDQKGAQVDEVPGAKRIGDHPILKRHEEVVGPKITAAIEGMSPGVIHDFLTGLGVGATEAPGDSYRIEAHLADLIRQHLGKHS